MSETQLGQVPVAKAGRDAIHLAVAPVVAGEDLKPGTHVELNPDGTAIELIYPDYPKVGIVDPFLTGVVRAGERFWLCLYPKTVTGIRHEWSHPAFGGPGIPPPPQPADAAAVEKAKAWITHWAASLPDAKDYKSVMIAAGGWVDYQQQSQSWNNGERDIPAEFWAHYKTITGKTGGGTFFACCPN